MIPTNRTFRQKSHTQKDRLNYYCITKAPFIAVVYYHALGAFTLGVRDTSVMSP